MTTKFMIFENSAFLQKHPTEKKPITIGGERIVTAEVVKTL